VRDRVAVDVRVEHANAVAELREDDREIRGKRRFAHAALAARDREHAAVGRQPDHALALGCAAAQLLRQRLPLLRRHHVEGELSSRHAGNTGESLLHLLLERIAQGTTGDGEDDRERDDAVVHLQVAHHVELGNRAPELRIDHMLERLQDLVAIDLHAASVAPDTARGRR